MTASDASLIGIAKQTAAGTPNTTDNAFKYLLFSQGSFGPQNQVLPLDPEVGGGVLLRDVKKVGVTSGGALELIPRADTVGMFLAGAIAAPSSAKDGTTDAYTHTFKLPTVLKDQYDAPYFTLRYSPGNMWGEQYQDCRVAAFGLSFAGSNFVRGSIAFQGGLPAKIATTAWNAVADGTPPFITPVSSIELPTGSAIKVLSGSFTAGMAIPLDEQWIVGSYSPDAQDIVSRSFAIQLAVKITDASLYSKIMYDPAAGNAWVAKLMREGKVTLTFNSDIEASTGKPYSLTIVANGQTDTDGNVIWSAQPLGLRAGRQVIMGITGIFVADPDGTHNAITATLYNKTVSY